MKKSTRRKSNRKGVVLYTMVAVSTVVMVLTATIVGFVQQANDTSYNNYYKKQAYYTATTCLENFVSIVNGNKDSTVINNLTNVANGSLETDVADLPDNMGECKIKVSNVAGSSGKIKIEAIATYRGVEQKATAYMQKKANKKSNSSDKALEQLSAAGAHNIDNATILGNSTAYKLSESGTAAIADMPAFNDGNNSLYAGEYAYYGTYLGSTQNTFRESATDPNIGVQVNVTGHLIFTNQSHISSLVAKSSTDNTNTTNYINVDGAFVYTATSMTVGDADHQIDLYAHSVAFGLPSSSNLSTSLINDKGPTSGKSITELTGFSGSGGMNGTFEIYGNVYSYKSGTDSVLNGDMYFDTQAGSVKIHGDAYCEGMIYVSGNNKVEVDGQLVVSKEATFNKIKSSTQFADVVKAGKVIYDPSTESSGELTKSGRSAVPDSLVTKSPYTIYPEDLISCNQINGETNQIATEYKALINGTNTKTIDDYKREYTDSELGIKFDYYIDGSCWWDKDIGNANVYIKVDNVTDLVIAMKSGVKIGGKVIVDNQSSLVDIKDEKTGVVLRQDRSKCCYFVPAVNIGTIGSTTDSDGDTYSTHTGFTPYSVDPDTEINNDIVVALNEKFGLGNYSYDKIEYVDQELKVYGLTTKFAGWQVQNNKDKDDLEFTKSTISFGNWKNYLKFNEITAVEEYDGNPAVTKTMLDPSKEWDDYEVSYGVITYKQDKSYDDVKNEKLAAQPTSSTIYAENSEIWNRNTYKAIVKDGKSLNVRTDYDGVNIMPGKTVTTSDGNTSYLPETGSILFLVPECAKIETSNQTFFECIIFAPQATTNFKQNSSTTFNNVYCCNDGTNDIVASGLNGKIQNLLLLGNCITGGTTMDGGTNQLVMAMLTPSSKSGFASASSKPSKETPPYQLLYYDYS